MLIPSTCMRTIKQSKLFQPLDGSPTIHTRLDTYIQHRMYYMMSRAPLALWDNKQKKESILPCFSLPHGRPLNLIIRCKFKRRRT